MAWCQGYHFESDNAEMPAKFYFNSAPAHTTYPTVHIKPEGEAQEGVVIVKMKIKWSWDL